MSPPEPSPSAGRPAPRYLAATLATTATAVGTVIALLFTLAALLPDPDEHDAPGAGFGLLVLIVLLAMVTAMAAFILPLSARRLHREGRLHRSAFVRLSAMRTAQASVTLVSGVLLLVRAPVEPMTAWVVLGLLLLHLMVMLPLALLWLAVALRR